MHLTVGTWHRSFMMMMKLPILPCAEKLESYFVYRTKIWNNTDKDSKETARKHCKETVSHSDSRQVDGCQRTRSRAFQSSNRPVSSSICRPLSRCNDVTDASTAKAWRMGNFLHVLNPLKSSVIIWLYFECSLPCGPNLPFLILTFGHSGAQGWAPECPNVRN